MTVVYEADITVTMRGVDDPVGLPYTVHPMELAGRDALIEIRRGPDGDRGPQGDMSWPWQWMGDVADFATAKAMGLGTADARKAWRVVDENAIYLWTGMDWIRFANAFKAPGPQGPPNVLTGEAAVGAVGSDADAEIIGDAPGQTLRLTIPRGETGDEGDPGVAGAISEAADVAEIDIPRKGSVLTWRTADEMFHAEPSPALLGPWAIASGQFSGASNIATSPLVIATMNIPAQPIRWRPIVLTGSIEMHVNTSSTNDTRADVEVRLGAADGDLIGYGFGIGSKVRYQVLLHPRWEYPVSPGIEGFGIVEANQTATLFVLVRRQFGSRNYSIVNAGAQMIVMGQPLEEQS
jgi:hypothetical protein